jgi:hypothetical protein
MSITVSAVRTRIKPADVERAKRLLEADDVSSRAAEMAHRDGWHVGLNIDETNCPNCNWGSDMPFMGTANTAEYIAQARAQYLERNIVFAVAAMRLNADLVTFDGALEP